MARPSHIPSSRVPSSSPSTSRRKTAEKITQYSSARNELTCLCFHSDLPCESTHVSQCRRNGERWRGLPGLYLQRFPKQVREQLNNPGRQSGQDNCGVEIRFKTSAPQVRVTLTAHLGDEGEAILYKGAYEHTRYKLPHGVTTTISLPYVVNIFDGQPPECLHSGGFSTDVWRICLHRCAVRFHDIDTFGHPLLPLVPGDTPRIRWLAYGSSITHAWLDGYIFMAARLLEVDVANKGLGGGCHAEPEAARFLAAQDWDFLTVELGINMISDFSPKAFKDQIKRFLSILREARPDKPIVILSPFRNGLESSPLPDPKAGDSLRAYRTILAKGTEILDRVDFLKCDLVHPSIHGHALMGVNLARLLQPLIDALKLRVVS